MKARHVTALASVSLFAGFYVGAVTNSSVPETHVVTVEKPVVHVEHETKTVYETKPLPDSCETAIDMVRIVTDAGGEVGRRGGKMVAAMAEVNPTMLFDPTKVNTLYASLVHNKILLDDALTIQLEKNTSLKFQLQSCDADVEASNNGDDVAPLDGEPGTTP